MFNLPSGGIGVTLEAFDSYIECKKYNSQGQRECDTDTDEDWEVDWMHNSPSQIIKFGSEQKSWDWKERRQKPMEDVGQEYGGWSSVGPGISTTNQWGFDEFRCIFLQFFVIIHRDDHHAHHINIKERTACLMIWPDGDTPGTLMDHLYQVIMNHDGNLFPQCWF